MENTTDLREKDLEIHALIEAEFAASGFAPSVQEIADRLGMSKGGVLSDCLKRLEAAGRIIYQPARKYFIPANWRVLAGASYSEKLDNIMDGFNKGYDAGIAAEKERTRELAAARLQRFRDKNKKARG